MEQYRALNLGPARMLAARLFALPGRTHVGWPAVLHDAH